MRDAHGRYLPGPDASRHALTKRDRKKGYRHAAEATGSSWDLAAWLWRRVRGYYRAAKRREHRSRRMP